MDMGTDGRFYDSHYDFDGDGKLLLFMGGFFVVGILLMALFPLLGLPFVLVAYAIKDSM